MGTYASSEWRNEWDRPEDVAFYVTMEFKVLRRIAWDGELRALRSHLDTVCEHLESNPDVGEWNLKADLDEATLEVQVVVAASDENAAEACARSVVGEAIRRAGAMHEGLLSLREESSARIHANAWYGLRTPKWQPRRVELCKI